MMKALAIASILLFSGAVAAQVDFGPGQPPGWTPPNDDGFLPQPPATGAPDSICYPSGICSIVSYIPVGQFMLAISQTLDGYPVLGWSGPCDQPTVGGCPSIRRQAYNDLHVNVINAQRARAAR
jgi:hypothetical protein